MKFHYKAQLAAALIAAAFAGTALAGPVLYTTETTDITSTPGANVAGQVLAGTQVEELERVSGKARVRIRGWSRVADPTHISAEPGKPVRLFPHREARSFGRHREDSRRDLERGNR